MVLYLLKRIAAMIPTLLGITLITFLIINLAPGDPVAAEFQGGAAGSGAEASGGGSSDVKNTGDSIKAKRKLLGMMTEDYVVHTWATAVSASPEGPVQQGPTADWGELGAFANSLAVSPLGDRVAVGLDTGAIVLLDAGSGTEQARLEGHPEAVWALDFSADGTRLASADIDGAVKIWDLAAAAAVAERGGAGRPIRDLEWLPDGSAVLAAGGDGVINALSAEDLRVSRAYEGHNQGVAAIELSADGRTMWSGGVDRKLREWDLATGEVRRVNEAVPARINDLALSPDGTRLATATDDRLARVIALSDFEGEGTVLAGHYKRVAAVTWSADSSRVITASSDETVRVWDPDTGVAQAEVKELIGAMYDVELLPSGEVLTAADSWRKVSVIVQYYNWLKRIVTLDLGRSFVDDRPVLDKIKAALPITLWLNVIALIIIYVVSIPLGVLAAVKRGTLFDHVSSIILFVLYSVPNFWLATLLIMFFSSKQNWDILPSVGLISDNAENLSFIQYCWDGIKHLILPEIVMVYAGFASLSRYARTSLLETIGEDYIRTARAKGLEESVVIYKHALRNSLITIITLVANLLPAMIGGSVIVEYIFSIQGMGKLGFDAILSRDYPVIMAITTFSAFLTLLGILVSDLLYGVVDPRVSTE